MSKFNIGDNVEVIQLIDQEIDKSFIGKKGVIGELNCECRDNFYTVNFGNNITEGFWPEELRKIEYLYIFIKFVKVLESYLEGVDLFWDKDEAEKAFKVLTRHDYPKDGNWEVIPEKYRNCYIVKMKLPERK